MIICFSTGCITNPSPSDNLPNNRSEVTTISTPTMAVSPIIPNQTIDKLPGQEIYSNGGISFIYPDFYNSVDGRLQSIDNTQNITIYRTNLSELGYGWGLNTADGIYNTILNRIANAKIAEQHTGNWTDPYRSVKKILSPSLNAYIIEGNAGSELRYYIPWGKNTSYVLTFSYPNTVQANFDETNRMAIIDSINIQ